MHKIKFAESSHNVEYYNDGCVRSVKGCKGDFLMCVAVQLPESFKNISTGKMLKEVNFIFDEYYANNFKFSVSKDYLKKENIIIFTIEGAEPTDSFAIIGFEFNEQKEGE